MLQPHDTTNEGALPEVFRRFDDSARLPARLDSTPQDSVPRIGA